MSEETWLDVSVLRCPKCRRYYVDASWYAIELESDIECGSCHNTFNGKKCVTDRIMMEFEIDENGRMVSTKILRHIPMETKG